MTFRYRGWDMNRGMGILPMMVHGRDGHATVPQPISKSRSYYGIPRRGI